MLNTSDNGILIGQDGKLFSMDYTISNDRLDRVSFFEHRRAWVPESWIFLCGKTYHIVGTDMVEVA